MNGPNGSQSSSSGSKSTNRDERVRTVVAASILGVKPSTLRLWRHQRYGPRYTKLRGVCSYRIGDLEDYLDKHLVETRESLGLEEAWV